MSGDTAYERPKKHNVAPIRVHDYLYDSAFIVSGARDYARTSFKAAMASAQVGIQPVYNTMFSELRKYPRAPYVYHPNCRLPEHIDRTYGGYLVRVQGAGDLPHPDLCGKDRFKYSAMPKKVLALKCSSPDFHPPTPVHMPMSPTKPKSRGTQSVYRESSAQTIPWQPDGKAAKECANTPEVLYLEKFEWGPGRPYRTGDLPADFHTTEIINKMRHARTWNELIDRGSLPRWMKKNDAIIKDVETRDWLFREAEIDELQGIRLELLNRMQTQQRQKQNTRNSKKLAKLWDNKKQEMEKKVEHIRHTRDRELRKLAAIHVSGGRVGKVSSMRAARGLGSIMAEARDPTSDLYAPLARHGYQARRRHADIYYDPSLLSLEDHKQCSEPPAWLHNCGQNLLKSCSGHHLPRDVTQLCIRQTKWSEEFLEQLHNDLKILENGRALLYWDRSIITDRTIVANKPDIVLVDRSQRRAVLIDITIPHDENLVKAEKDKLSKYLDLAHEARLGAASNVTAGPLRVLKPRKIDVPPRPATPEVEAVCDEDETSHQAALLLQKVLRGRAVQILMYEGRTRAAELTEELKTTHGLQKEDRVRIAREEAKAREYNAFRTDAEQKEDAIAALVDELCGGAVSAALDFLEKELRRLKEERRQHAFILIALREKMLREAAEAGRRQKELRRMREHDEMFKQVLGVTQETVEEYFREIVQEGVALAAEGDAVARARAHADSLDDTYNKQGAMSTAEEHETVAELVQQFLLPEAHKQASRRRVSAMQDARAHAARDAIFGLVDEAVLDDSKRTCIRCGCPLGEICRCLVCPPSTEPTATESRDDPRWKHTRARPKPPPKSAEERYPPQHEFRCMLNTLVQEVVEKSREHRRELEGVARDCSETMREKLTIAIETRGLIDYVIDRATGVITVPVRDARGRHYSRRFVGDALERTEPFPKPPCPRELPSVIRRRAEEAAALEDPTCRCEDEAVEVVPKARVTFTAEVAPEEQDPSKLLPSALRALEELRRCKCDTDASPSTLGDDEMTETTEGDSEMTTAAEGEDIEEQTDQI